MSVVVPTKNSDSTLSACLKSIDRQTYANVAKVVVDNYSTDKTREIAADHGATFVTTGPERSAQRNEGARRSGAPYLLFIDSDMELQPQVVEECVDRGKKGYQGVIVPEVSKGKGFWARCRALEKQCYIGDDDIEAARFFDSSAFFAQGGYDEQIAGGGEDWDLPLRIRAAGGKIGRIDAHVVHNEGRLELGKSLRKKFYYGRTIPIYRRKHPEVAQRQLRLLRPAFVRNWRQLAQDPLHGTGLVILKIGELGAGGLGYLSARLWGRGPSD